MKVNMNEEEEEKIKAWIYDVLLWGYCPYPSEQDELATAEQDELGAEEESK